MKAKGKLFIQIPCLNEQATIGSVLKSIPIQKLNELGLSVKTLVIDDNSGDRTLEYAKRSGADFFIKHRKTVGLARTFKDGLNFCLNHGADIIVNTDGDDQYDQNEILKLINPILKGEADMVIGDRQINKLRFMPLNKKIGNLFGSWVLRVLTGVEIPDASSGFRAFDKELGSEYNLQSDHTYTHETIIQAANKGFGIISIPVNFKKRSNGTSRLISAGVYDHIKKSSGTIIRSILLYKAFKYLLVIGGFITTLGILVGVRFLYFFLDGRGTGHIQSLVLSSVLINLGFMVIVLGFIADLISVNRKTIESLKSKIKS
ncbi:MAG TPA: glycosyltransferase family 2 protein, partial [Patescibacteria group bacterium]|nr:glycosyltransferase family 2 protein [Patescibacteria group bacterium]